MAKLILLVILTSFSITGFSQDFWDFSDIGDASQQLQYSKGLSIKSHKKNTLDTSLWDKATNGNTETYTSIPMDDKMAKKIKVEVTYDDIRKKRPKINEIHQVVSSDDGKKEKVERVFTTTIKSKKTTDATECKRIPGSDKFSCFSVDHNICPRLKREIKGSKLSSTSEKLKECASSLNGLNGLISQKKIEKDLSKTNSFLRTAAPIKKDIATVNGNIIGKQLAQIDHAALDDIFQMISLCEKNDLHKRKIKKSPKAKKKKSVKKEN